MAEQLLAFDDAQLERALLGMSDELAFPPTPDVSAIVLRRLADRPRANAFQRWLSSPRRRLALTLVALLVLLALALAGLAAADRLGLRGLILREVVSVPAGVPSPSAPVGEALSLGTATTLDAARARLNFQVQVPEALGEPDEVYVRDVPRGGQVALVYRPRADLPAANQTGVGALLTAFQATVSNGVLGKGLPPGTRLEEVRVGNGRGFWIEGDPHQFFYIDAAGAGQTETLRLAGNVVLWEVGPVTYRLELAGSKDQAVKIAASLR